MIDLGDPVSLTVTCTDLITGALVDGAPSLTITKPDGTTTVVPSGDPSISHVSTGVYRYTYTPATAGRFNYYWQAVPGATTSAYDGTFIVTASGGLIISLEEARASLRAPAGVTVDDEDLRSLIAAAAGPMEDLCGPILRRSCDEWHDGGSAAIKLLEPPVISITSITESIGAGTFYTLTNQVLDGGGTFDSYGYNVELDTGMVYRRYSGVSGAFQGGRRSVHVKYVAGRAVMPHCIVRGTRRLVRWLWQTEMQGQRPNGSKPEQVTYTDSGYAVPNAVVQLVRSELRMIGVA